MRQQEPLRTGNPADAAVQRTSRAIGDAQVLDHRLLVLRKREIEMPPVLNPHGDAVLHHFLRPFALKVAPDRESDQKRRIGFTVDERAKEVHPFFWPFQVLRPHAVPFRDVRRELAKRPDDAFLDLPPHPRRSRSTQLAVRQLSHPLHGQVFNLANNRSGIQFQRMQLVFDGRQKPGIQRAKGSLIDKIAPLLDYFLYSVHGSIQFAICVAVAEAQRFTTER